MGDGQPVGLGGLKVLGLGASGWHQRSQGCFGVRGFQLRFSGLILDGLVAVLHLFCWFLVRQKALQPLSANPQASHLPQPIIVPCGIGISLATGIAPSPLKAQGFAQFGSPASQHPTPMHHPPSLANQLLPRLGGGLGNEADSGPPS